VNNVIAGNTYDGVLIFDGHPADNLIQANLIIYNGWAGIGAYYGSRNRFMGNAIFGNAYLGIELGPQDPDNVTFNDLGDADTGTNNRQNFPVVTSAVLSGAATNIAGTLNSAPGKMYVVELFASPACDSEFGHGQGAFPLGLTAITTDASGSAPFNVGLPFAIPAGWSITSTATDPEGNTSEFSGCRAVN
jgi:hypothetical protein